MVFGIIVVGPRLQIPVFGVFVAKLRIEGKEFGANGVPRAGNEIETGKCFTPESPGFVWWSGLVWN